MMYKIYVNGKFIGYGHADDLIIAQIENPNAEIIAEKC